MNDVARQELGWVRLSRRLTDTVARAAMFAGEQQHGEVTLDHLVLALVDDTDAARVLEANGVNVARFRDFTARYLAAVESIPAVETPMPDAAMHRIFDVSSAAAQSSNRDEIDGALVVAAIIGEGTSNAALMLRQHGLRLDDEVSEADPRDLEASSEAPFAAHGAELPASATREDLSDVHALLSQPIVSRREAITAPQPPRASSPATPYQTVPALETPTLTRTRLRQPAPRRQVNGSGHSAAQPTPKAVIQPNIAPPNGPAGPAVDASVRSVGSAPASVAAVTPPPVRATADAPVAPPPRPFPSPPFPETPTSKPTSRSGMGDAPSRISPPPAPSVSGEVDDWDGADDPVSTVDGVVQLEDNILTEIIPSKVRLGVTERVEIRVMNADIDELTGQFEGRDLAISGASLVSRSLSLRLRSPSGSFTIEPRSPEVQWFEPNAAPADDDSTSWRWQITATKSGVGRLQLFATARIVTRDGVVLQTALPEQMVEVRIVRGVGAVMQRLFALGLFFAGGLVLGLAARPAYRFLLPFIE
ncbi:MAG: Clp protease N-terminal domain-containing protein [Pseudomonadota bacterium]